MDDLNYKEILQNIDNYILAHGAKLYILDFPTTQDITCNSVLTKIVNVMYTEPVYVNYDNTVQDKKYYFNHFHKYNWAQLVKENFDLYKKCIPNFTDEYIKQISEADPDLVQNDKYFRFEDYSSTVMNIKNGIRKGIDTNYKNNIFMFGNSTMFGYYVADDETIAYYLSQQVNYNVYNCATNNDTLINIYNRISTMAINPNDIVIIGIPHFMIKQNISIFPCIMLSDYFNSDTDYEKFMDRAHFTAFCHKDIANIIAQNIVEEDNIDKYQDKVNIMYNDFFSVISKEQFDRFDGSLGASVMSCNPFTSGHKHLVKLASQTFDYFFIFLMQEGMNLIFDKKVCEDLVREGTKEFDNVFVIPMSPVFSYQTFWPQYNDLVLRHECKNFLGINTYELLKIVQLTFNKLNIQHFICGIEADDSVTRQHFNQLNVLFPKHNINVINIPRKKMNNIKSISGTQCRKLLKEQRYDELQYILPAEVLQYIVRNKIAILEKQYSDKMLALFEKRYQKEEKNYIPDNMIMVEEQDFISVFNTIKNNVMM